MSYPLKAYIPLLLPAVRRNEPFQLDTKLLDRRIKCVALIAICAVGLAWATASSSLALVTAAVCAVGIIGIYQTEKRIALDTIHSNLVFCCMDGSQRNAQIPQHVLVRVQQNPNLFSQLIRHCFSYSVSLCRVKSLGYQQLSIPLPVFKEAIKPFNQNQLIRYYSTNIDDFFELLSNVECFEYLLSIGIQIAGKLPDLTSYYLFNRLLIDNAKDLEKKVDLLIRSGINIDAKDRLSKTVLEELIFMKVLHSTTSSDKMIKILIKKGADTVNLIQNMEPRFQDQAREVIDRIKRDLERQQ